MITLTNTTHILELGTTTTSGINYFVSYVDHTPSGGTIWDNQGSIASITTTTILSAPAAATQRQVKLISIENTGTTANTVTIKKDVSGTEYVLYSATLQAGENLTYADGSGFDKHSKGGDETSVNVSEKNTPISARSLSVLKVWTTAEAAGIMHTLALSTGNPWAWSPWAPWVNGRATDGTTTADNGCLKIPNPSSGSNYITGFSVSATTACVPMLLDVLWVNTGLVVTTTTAQAITPVSLPARDANWTSNGENVNFAIFVTTATTNAGVIANTTISYTNQDWVSGRTGTMSSFPITAVAGTIVPFQLAAWDTGIRSVQSVTLGTSYGAGAISLIGYRIITLAPHLIANAGWKFQPAFGSTNTKIHNWVCLLPAYMPTVTTATTLTAFVNIEEK